MNGGIVDPSPIYTVFHVCNRYLKLDACKCNFSMIIIALNSIINLTNELRTCIYVLLQCYCTFLWLFEPSFQERESLLKYVNTKEYDPSRMLQFSTINRIGSIIYRFSLNMTYAILGKSDFWRFCVSNLNKITYQMRNVSFCEMKHFAINANINSLVTFLPTGIRH